MKGQRTNAVALLEGEAGHADACLYKWGVGCCAPIWRSCEMGPKHYCWNSPKLPSACFLKPTEDGWGLLQLPGNI